MICRTAVLANRSRFPKFAWLVLVLTLLPGCMALHPPPERAGPTVRVLLSELMPADVLLLGEQHDAPQHQQRQTEVLNALLPHAGLAALVVEMAETGLSTSGLTTDASEHRVRQALNWPFPKAAGWDWSVYGPLVMYAVRAGIPVWGGNLPRSDIRATMGDASLDTRLPTAAWMTMQNLIREGHCQMLPESQVVPMTRVQVARDLSMAQVAQKAMRPGKTVLLVAGNQHVRRDLGVPLHWSVPVRSRVILMTSGTSAAFSTPVSGDRIWTTPALPPVDHCAKLKGQLPR